MKPYLIVVLIVSVLVSGLLIGCAQPKATEDVIPLVVPDFTLVEKKERIEGLGWEQYSSSLFIPSEGSKFQNKVEELQVQVSLVKDVTTATSTFEMWTQMTTATSIYELFTQNATKIKVEVEGVDTVLLYNETGSRMMSNARCGSITAIQQRGRLWIYSCSFSPIDFEGWVSGVPTIEFDKEALTDAAIRGLIALRL